MKESNDHLQVSGFLQVAAKGSPLLEEIAGRPLSRPVPIYDIDLTDITPGNFTSAAKTTGWFLAPVGDESQLIRVLPGDADNPQGGFSTHSSRWVGDYFKSIAFARSQFAAAPESFELRLLRIPAMIDGAIWLHREKSDVFIRMDGKPAVAADYAESMTRRAIALQPLSRKFEARDGCRPG